MNVSERLFRELMGRAGIAVNGPEPWDIHVSDPRFYGRVLAWKNLGLGEAYMDGWWDCPRLDEFFCRVLSAGLEDQVRGNLRLALSLVPALVLNRQTRRLSRRVARRHYDLDTALFAAFLDPNMQYSCAYFTDGEDLERAQLAKMELICAKLGLGPEDHLLDIGCGFGGLARYAASTRGCRVTGVNISREQLAFARKFCAGLPVELVERDYRELSGTYSRVVSVGMFEHVGARNHRAFLRAVRRVLEPGGVFLLHTIGSNRSAAACDPWINRYIFPGGQLPSPAQIGAAGEGLFVIEDWHNLGPHYARTLRCWHENFEAAWPRLAERFDERFHRMWRYYLLSCAGAFAARDIQVWQLVMTPTGAAQPACRLGAAGTC